MEVILSSIVALAISISMCRLSEQKINIQFNQFKQEITQQSLDRYQELKEMMLKQGSVNKEMLENINNKIEELKQVIYNG